MDQLSSHEEVEIPMPINSAYCGVLHGHDMTHIHAPPNNNGHNSNIEEQHQQEEVLLEGYNGNFIEGNKKKVKYRECQKNHAATMGGNAIDGCGEFMASGEEGTLEALICSACNCHRNFHRKEIEGSSSDKFQFYPPTTPQSTLNARGRKVILGNVNVVPFSRSVPINMSYQVDHDDHQHYHGYGLGNGMVMRYPLNNNYNNNANQGVKKRFRTKFSQEQKEKMLEFAEKIGWRFQKQEESLVQQFCQEIGVKRRVLKVWMHNNKHTLATKTNNLIHNNNNSSSSV